MARQASLSFTGAGSIGDFDTANWSVQEDITPHVPGKPSGTVGSASWRAGAELDSSFIKNNVAVFGVEGNDTYVGYQTLVGHITDVAPGPVTVGATQGTALSAFVAERSIPAVSSGSPVGALDLCMSLAGNRAIPASTTPATLVNGQFWTLRGHDVGFDYYNNALTPQDQSSVVLIYNNSTGLYDTPQLLKKVVNNVHSGSWTAVGTELYAGSVTGSSPYPVAGEGLVVRFDTILNGANLVYTLTTGPDDLNLGTGIEATITVNYSAATIAISGSYNPGGTPTGFSASSSISTLNKDTKLAVAIYFGWTDSTHFTLEAKIANTSTLSTVVTVTSGSLNANIDQYSNPYTLSGNIQNLFQCRVAAGYDYGTNILVGMGNGNAGYSTANITNGQLLAMLDNPINGFTGTMWDYLNAVAAATGWEYRVNTQTSSSTIVPGANMTQLGTLTMTLDNTVGIPGLTIGSAGAGQNVDVVHQNTSLVTNVEVYDALTAGETWSVAAGETQTVIIQTTNSITLAENPTPYSSLDEFSSATTGAYLVSGSDNLPIPASEWIAYGGSVVVNSSGVDQIEVTFHGPNTEIPGVPGPYSFAVSDGSTTYPTLTLFGSGTLAQPQTFTFPTGADSTLTSIISVGTIDNPAVTSLARLYSASMWAGSFACADMTLTCAIDIDQFALGGVLGYFSGNVFSYRNMKWRVINSTISPQTVTITAVPYTTMANMDSTWSGSTYATMQAAWPSPHKYEDFILEPLKTQ